MLLVVESMVSDADVDLRDEYRERVFERWTSEDLQPVAGLTNGRLHEPPGVGLALLLTPAYAAAGTVGAELLVAALAALGLVAAAALARRLVPDPWATGAVVVFGLSSPVLAWSTTLTPEPVAAAAVAGAALFTLRVRDAPHFGRAAMAAVLIGLLPWLSMKFVPIGIVCAAALARWLRRRSRGFTALAALEIVLVPTVALISVNERLYGGLTPYAAVPGDPTGVDRNVEYLERIPRLVSALFDPGLGVLVHAPAGVLAFLALELLARYLRERLEVALPGVVDLEVTAGFLAALCGAQLLVAAFGAPDLGDDAFPGRELLPALGPAAALSAWALRRAPRVGGALCALTVAGGVWLLVAGRVDGDAQLAPPAGAVPWGGAEAVVCAGTVATGVFLVARELWRDRELDRALLR